MNIMLTEEDFFVRKSEQFLLYILVIYFHSPFLIRRENVFSMERNLYNRFLQIFSRNEMKEALKKMRRLQIEAARNILNAEKEINKRKNSLEASKKQFSFFRQYSCFTEVKKIMLCKLHCKFTREWE